MPGDTYECSYALEYGTATVEIHKADVKKGQKFLVVDDLIATGGTLAASKNLIEQGGGEVTDFFGVLMIVFGIGGKTFLRSKKKDEKNANSY